MHFSLGRFSFSIDGDESLFRFLSSEWIINENSQSQGSLIQLHIERAPRPNEIRVIDGWNSEILNGYRTVVYSVNGIALFSLKYAFPVEKVLISVFEVNENSAKIAIQYALMIALNPFCIGFHGVTLLCNNEIIILSAPSGTGKTTLSRLLEKYIDAIVINGDFALLSLYENNVIFEPTPFCGSSARCLNHRIKVNRIVFLEQSKQNKWHKFNGRESLKRFMSNCFVPEWDSDIIENIEQNVLNCISLLRINAFSFAPTMEAAKTFVDSLGNNDD